MAELAAVLVLGALLIVQAVLGSRRSTEDGDRIERMIRLHAAQTAAERTAALAPDRPASTGAVRDPDRPSKPIGV